MILKNYINPSDVNESIINIKIDKYTLNIVNLYGYIYRADVHQIGYTIDNIFDTINNKNINDSNAFFGDRQSAIKYLYDNNYLKKYITKKPIKLISLNNSIENINLIKDFFKNYLMNLSVYKDDLIIKVTYILLQISYGLIDGDVSNIDLCDLSIDTITNYLKNAQNQRKNKAVNDRTINLFKKIVTEFSKEKPMSSRISIAELDAVSMTFLSKILKPYDINGIWSYTDKSTYTDNTICMVVNKLHYESDSTSISCVPSDMCIFNPIYLIKLIDIKQRRGNELIDISMSTIKSNKLMKRHNININHYQKSLYKDQYVKYKKRYNNIKK
jgi:hypothetical protein